MREQQAAPVARDDELDVHLALRRQQHLLQALGVVQLPQRLRADPQVGWGTPQVLFAGAQGSPAPAASARRPSSWVGHTPSGFRRTEWSTCSGLRPALCRPVTKLTAGLDSGILC